MSAQIQPVLEYVTTCRLCGKDVAKALPLDIPLIGQPGKRTEQLMAVLVKHISKHHAAELQLGMGLLAEFQAFCILTAFDYEDPCIAPRLELTRAAVFARVRKNTMLDTMIEHVIASFGLDPEDNVKVIGAMKALRDACCELGEYAPKVPTEPAKRIITA